MSRFTIRGRDPVIVPKRTQWQAERMRGPILPMEEPRKPWFRFRRIGR